MRIERNIYLNELIERMNNGMIKIITGIRRCGKSYLLFTLFKEHLLLSGVSENHIIEIALDGIENEELRDPKLCYSYIKEHIKDGGQYYVIIDEVQFMPRFEEVLNSLFLISKVSRYDIKGRKYIGTNLKYYFTDIGLRNARLNFRQQEPTHIMENIVYNELLVRGLNVDPFFKFIIF